MSAVSLTRYQELCALYELELPEEVAYSRAMADAQYEADEREAIQMESKPMETRQTNAK